MKNDIGFINDLEVSTKLEQIVKVNINIPINDDCGMFLYTNCVSLFERYMVDDDCHMSFENIPKFDFNVFMLSCYNQYALMHGDNYIISTVMGLFATYCNIHRVNLTFVRDEKLVESYKNILDDIKLEDKTKLFLSIYEIMELELHLCSLMPLSNVKNMNEMFMFFELVENDYLNRTNEIEFSFDDYMSFMEMVISNGSIMDSLNPEIFKKLLCFPLYVTESKPTIRVITDYVNVL